MIKSGNQYIKPEKVNYEHLINVWVDEQKRIDIVKHLMITDKNFRLEKIRTNPMYQEVYQIISVEKDKALEKLDKSWLWSRKYTPTKFARFIIPFSGYALIFIPYIFYKVLQKRIFEKHVKHSYDADNLKDSNYWNLDFENKDLYPDSVIKLYFEVKKKKEFAKEEEKKAIAYSEKFVENISRGYLSDFTKRRKSLGFNDEEY